MAAKFTTVEEYISSFPEEVQAILREVRRRIHRAVPAAGDRISYQMPTISVDGTSLVHYAAWKHHLGVYPIPAGDEAFERDIAPYNTGKGTAKFRYQEPIPYELIERLAAYLMQERRWDGADRSSAWRAGTPRPIPAPPAQEKKVTTAVARCRESARGSDS